MIRHYDDTTFGAGLTTHEARNVGNVGLPEFGTTIPDIGPGRPKSPKDTHIEPFIRRIPKSLFGEALLAHTYLSHKPPTFRLDTSDYADSPKLSKETTQHPRFVIRPTFMVREEK
ncbi:hypothetical protein PIB30_082800 [Stylosanthes scabra]|uniref:Uncharacterized protein n=1 Tax=Stylosanthes scabra TaxID=79078 RepID=A0ABU6VUQ8_9FABA|nr:hypothetical protein [Stylosanthes scabra]